MERDCLGAQGIASAQKEMWMEKSDKHKVHVCDDCGMICNKVKRKKSYACPVCGIRSSGVSPLIIPYAFKTMQQLLLAERIGMGLRT